MRHPLIGSYHPLPTWLKVVRVDPMRRALIDSMDRDALLAGIVKHLQLRAGTLNGAHTRPCSLRGEKFHFSEMYR